MPGRPRRSAVWEYFVYDSESDKSVCQIEIPASPGAGSEGTSDGKGLCGQSVPGKFPTDLKQHLKKHHPKQLQEVLDKEKEQKAKPKGKKPIGPGQLTITQALEGKPLYGKDSDRYHKISKRLAVFIGSTNAAISLVDNPEFRSLVGTLDPRYPMPGRTLMGKKLDMLVAELKGNIQQYMSTAQRLSLCADI